MEDCKENTLNQLGNLPKRILWQRKTANREKSKLWKTVASEIERCQRRQLLAKS